MKTVLLTGASGFVGKNFIAYSAPHYKIIIVSLRNNDVEAIDFTGVDCVLHLAAKVHDMRASHSDEYERVNFLLTKKLAENAKRAGVKHFVFVSSVKVYGNNTAGILTEKTLCIPDDDYGKSKLKAEDFINTIQNSDFQVAIVRPPMVYGPEEKGNMIRLIRLCAKGYPLPFAGISNRRTVVYVENLVALIDVIISQKATGIYIPSDPISLSTSELINIIQRTLFGKPRTFKLPQYVRFFLKKSKPELYKRLFESFEFDNSSTLQALRFTPPYTTEQGVQKTVERFKTEQQK